VSAFNKSAKAKTVTAAEGQEGDAGAVFDLAPKLGAVSDERAANGGMMAGVKKAKDNHPKILPPAGPCFYPARSLRKIATDGTPRIFPGSGNFSQSPANQFTGATKLCWRNGATAGAKRSGGGAGRVGFWGWPVFAACGLSAGRKSGRWAGGFYATGEHTSGVESRTARSGASEAFVAGVNPSERPHGRRPIGREAELPVVA